MDARGHGMTTAPSGDEHYSWEIMAADVNRLMEHLGIERAIIGGLSMGGGVSLAYALNYPEKVKALILCDSAGAGVHSPDMKAWQEQMDRQNEERERVVREFGVVETAYRAIRRWRRPEAGSRRPGASGGVHRAHVTFLSQWLYLRQPLRYAAFPGAGY